MIEYLLVISDHEGIAIRAKHLPRIGETLDVVKDYGEREHFRFVVESVSHDVTVTDVPVDGVRGTVQALPFVQGCISERRIDNQWVPTKRVVQWVPTKRVVTDAAVALAKAVIKVQEAAQTGERMPSTMGHDMVTLANAILGKKV